MKHIVISIDNATVRIRADQVVATVEDGEGNVDIYIQTFQVFQRSQYYPRTY